MDSFKDIIHSFVWKETCDKSINNKLLSDQSLKLKGLPGSLKPLFLAILQERLNRPLVVVLPDRESAERMFEELSNLAGEEKVAFFPEGEEDAESPVIVNPRRAGLQMRVIRDLMHGSLQLVVVSAEGVAQRFPSPESIQNEWIELSQGIQRDLYQTVETLALFGYTRETMVERPGEISLRGGILDIFPFTGEEPHRVEFWGDRIESIRTFDLTTQRSTGQGESLHLIPAPPAWEDGSESLLAYFKVDPIVFWEDPDLIAAEVQKEGHRRQASLLSTDAWEILFNASPSIRYYTLSSPEDVMDFGGRTIRHPGGTAAEIRENLASLCDTRQGVFILCEQTQHLRRIQEFLDLDAEPIPKLRVEANGLQRGFDLPESGYAVYAEADLFGRTPRRRRRRFHLGVPIRELSSLSKGDFVVHVDHGIGQYQGLEKVTVQDTERECLSLLYRDGDKLFVPVDKMERVQKYAGRDGVQPSLSKLGSSQWERLKSRTKESIKNIARELIALYSARETLPGHAFSKDTPWQRELEATFVYEETRDQARTVDEVKTDMEKPRPMDRLVCGDVGYGKTEVAVRAAFKAVADGRQVAVLVPTTVLAQQHFRTFQERLSRFPVNIEMLSRFRGRKAQKSIVEKLNHGEVDIVIGTHRLLSKDVGFKNLGLLIIDEEQRFGVRHKERLKAFRKTVDVLALSATPIPRTLQFSLMGIRDMSLIATPPRDRLPIITEVLPFEEDVIVEAIEREISRGGQVFFVHNRIHSIHAVARMVRRLIPGIRLAVAHGRMEERELERAMLEFMEGEYDCLVATMIIESGLDIPNVNTLIVHRADRLGLSQLYQLRGRVGRSERRAFAYLLTPPFHLMTQDAIKRLRTIEEFTELGSGFQIALRDLEIRGAGNLLGVQQSGYMDAVGIDLYMRLVGEAVGELKKGEGEESEAKRPEVECRIDFDGPAYLPESYVSDESLRVNLYRRLSAIQNPKDIDAFEHELLDRFGRLPQEAENLLDVARLRVYGLERGFKRVFLKDRRLEVTFDETWVESFSDTELLSERLRSMIDSSPVPIQFLQTKEFGFRMSITDESPMAFTKKLLHSWG